MPEGPVPRQVQGARSGPGPRAGPAARRGPVDPRLFAAVPGLLAVLAVPVGAGLVSTAGVVLQALGLAHFLATLSSAGTRAGWRAWLGLFVTGAALRALGALAGELGAARASGRAKGALRRRLLLSATSRPGAWTTEGAGAGPGELVAIAGRGLDALDDYVGRYLPEVVLAGAAPLALLVALGVLDWLSALVVGVGVALFPVFGALVGKASLDLAGRRWARVEQLGHEVADTFEGLAVLRAFGAAGRQRARLARANQAITASSSAVLRVAFLSAVVLDTLASACVALVAVPLGLRLLAGGVPLADAFAVLAVAPEVFLPLRRASARFHDSTEGQAALARALEVGAAAGQAPAGKAPWRPGGPGAAGVGEAGAGPGAVARQAAADGPVAVGPDAARPASLELRHVTLRLAGGPQPVLDRADFTLAAGEVAVLQGASGAGKSALLRLMLGFVAPDEGLVLAGQRPLPGLARDRWLAGISYLSAEPALLAASLADNLRLGEPGATDAQLWSALGCLEAAELFGRDGLATLVGEGGMALSAGERQRVVLARTLLRRRPLYLLDEPTAHLDGPGEHVAVAALRQALAGATAVVVSHRRAVCALADRVVNLEAGRLEDQAGPARTPARAGLCP